MKKIRNVVLILALFMCFNGCEKNHVGEESLPVIDELTVDQAKAFIEIQRINVFALKSGNTQMQAVKIKADWSKARSCKNEKVSVVETELLTLGGKFGFATKQNYEDYQNTKKLDCLTSPTRLIIKKNKKTNETVGFFMTIIGDQDYLVKKGCNLANNTYIKMDDDFSGIVLFYNLDGFFVNGWRYSDGKISHSVSSGHKLDVEMQLKSASNWNCETTSYYYYLFDDRYQTVYTAGVNPIESYSYTSIRTIEIVMSDCTYEPSTGGGSTNTDTPALDPYNYNPVTEPVPMPAIELGTKFENNEKVMCIYSNLVQTAIKSFNPLVSSFLANFSDGVTINPGDIKFDLGSLDGAYGNSTQSGDMFIVLLNENEISTRAPLEIAKTLIHEILHAQIGHNLQITPNSFVSNFRQYLETINGVSDINDHQFMIANYVQPMMRFLKDYDSLNGYSASDEYYRSLALSGLEGIISTMEMNDLINAQNYFRNRGLNCQ